MKVQPHATGNVNVGQETRRPPFRMKPIKTGPFSSGTVYDVTAYVGSEGKGDVLRLTKRGRGRDEYRAAKEEYEREARKAANGDAPQPNRALANTSLALEEIRDAGKSKRTKSYTWAGVAVAGGGLAAGLTGGVLAAPVAAGLGVAVLFPTSAAAGIGFGLALVGVPQSLEASYPSPDSPRPGLQARLKGIVSPQTLCALLGPATDGRESDVRREVLASGLRELRVVDASPRGYEDWALRRLPDISDLQEHFEAMDKQLDSEARAKLAESVDLRNAGAKATEYGKVQVEAERLRQCAQAARSIADRATEIHDGLHAVMLDLERHVAKKKLSKEHLSESDVYTFDAGRPTLLSQLS